MPTNVVSYGLAPKLQEPRTLVEAAEASGIKVTLRMILDIIWKDFYTKPVFLCSGELNMVIRANRKQEARPMFLRRRHGAANAAWDDLDQVLGIHNQQITKSKHLHGNSIEP